MTWVELVAKHLAERDREPLVIPHERALMCAAGCGRWACVRAEVGMFCLSCWFRIVKGS